MSGEILKTLNSTDVLAFSLHDLGLVNVTVQHSLEVGLIG